MTTFEDNIDTALKRLRARLFHQLEPTAWTKNGLSPLNRVITFAILFSVAITIVDSEPLILAGREDFFEALETALAVLFSIEYLARIWVSGADPKYGPGLAGRLRYMRSPTALLDLLALTPLVLTTVGGEAYLLRLFRLVRVFRLAKLGRYSRAFKLLVNAVHARRFELQVSAAFALLMLLITSTLLYLVEGGTQPEEFGSIPRAMWWSVTTLTTVGYGDVYPHTVLGKILGGLTAIISIGFIAMPTGILAAAISDALQQRHKTHPADAAEKNAIKLTDSAL